MTPPGKNGKNGKPSEEGFIHLPLDDDEMVEHLDAMRFVRRLRPTEFEAVEAMAYAFQGDILENSLGALIARFSVQHMTEHESLVGWREQVLRALDRIKERVEDDSVDEILEKTLADLGGWK